MAKANKKSLDAKAYINAQVNEMKEKISKATDGETRQKLIENFKETTSSDEYQENLAIVQEDADAIRKQLREGKGSDVTSEEFEKAKIDFYGKNMDLEFGEDFEELDLGKKVDYIFEKFGDTDYAANLIINLLETLKPEQYYRGGWPYLKNIIDELIGENTNGVHYNKLIYNRLSKKFGNGVVTARVYFHLGDYVIWGGGFHDWMENLPNTYKYDNMTENTLKNILTTPTFRRFVLQYLGSGESFIESLVRGCEDGSISDLGLINILKNIITISDDNIRKLSLEGQKYFIDSFIKSGKIDMVKKNIDQFCWLTDEEKSEILGK